jgi:mono/diheme cytochrome c family protein
VKSCCITPRSRPQVGKRSIRRTSFPDSGDQKRVVVSRMVAAAEPAKPVVELGSFSILNPKPPGQVVSGDFSVDSGNAATGAKLFKAKCASCHTIKEGGAPCGPSWAAYRRGRVGSGRAAHERRAWSPEC